jgi:endonuclease YncB( thermonuclease family)
VKLSKALVWVYILLLWIVHPVKAQDGQNAFSAKVISIESGNLIKVAIADKKRFISILGIEVPTQAKRKEVREKLSLLIKDKTVQLQVNNFTENKDTIVKAKVLLEGKDIALQFIEDGYVWVDSAQKYLQRGQDARTYEEATQKAIELKKGFWGDSYKECKSSSDNKAPKDLSQDLSKPENMFIPNISGNVVVEVTVSQDGDVIEARATCGHPVVQTIAVKLVASYKLKKQSTIIIGTILYRFNPDGDKK